MHFNRLKLSGALEVFYHFTIFGLKIAKKFEENKFLSAFFQIEVQVISNPSS